MAARRKRGPYFFALLLVLVLGLLTHPARHFLPGAVTGNVGDALYALMAYLLLALVFPRLPPVRVFAGAFAFCALVETTQLYQSFWINTIRHTLIGGLILGYGFSWGDMAAYLAGASLGFFVELKLCHKVI